MNYDSLMDNIKRIHFIGIGGSGMCPLAEILHHEGYELSGSDMNEGETLDRIKGYGIPVFMGHAAENIKGAELVVYSAAIKETNPERQAAKELGIPCIERSVMLGIVTRRYRRSIAMAYENKKSNWTEQEIQPGQEIVYTAAQQQIKIDQADVEVITSWKDGKLIFRDTPFKEVHKMLSKRFDVDFVVKNPKCFEASFTGTEIGAEVPVINIENVR